MTRAKRFALSASDLDLITDAMQGYDHIFIWGEDSPEAKAFEKLYNRLLRAWHIAQGAEVD